MALTRQCFGRVSVVGTLGQNALLLLVQIRLRSKVAVSSVSQICGRSYRQTDAHVHHAHVQTVQELIHVLLFHQHCGFNLFLSSSVARGNSVFKFSISVTLGLCPLTFAATVLNRWRRQSITEYYPSKCCASGLHLLQMELDSEMEFTRGRSIPKTC